MAKSKKKQKCGAQMKDYIVDETKHLGHGTFGIVYIATHKRTKKEVAVKIIKHTDDTQILEKATETYQKLQKPHKNVINIIGLNKTTSELQIYMELCKGGDLTKYLGPSNSVPTLTRLHIMLQMAEGLEFLHAKNIIHRDLKPANVLIKDIIDGTPRVKLADFDISKYIDPKHETSRMNTNVGTSSFRAPEFWLGKGYHRDVDIYALGLVCLAIIQELNEGNGNLSPYLQTPSDTTEIHNPIGGTIYERLKNSRPPVWNIIPVANEEDSEFVKSMKDLIMKMTEARPKDRISASKVVAKLKSIIDNVQKLPEVPAIIFSGEPVLTGAKITHVANAQDKEIFVRIDESQQERVQFKESGVAKLSEFASQNGFVKITSGCFYGFRIPSDESHHVYATVYDHGGSNICNGHAVKEDYSIIVAADGSIKNTLHGRIWRDTDNNMYYYE